MRSPATSLIYSAVVCYSNNCHWMVGLTGFSGVSPHVHHLSTWPAPRHGTRAGAAAPLPSAVLTPAPLPVVAPDNHNNFALYAHNIHLIGPVLPLILTFNWKGYYNGALGGGTKKLLSCSSSNFSYRVVFFLISL